MTPEEVHQYNKSHAIGPISYEAVGTTEAVVAFRAWIKKWLAIAYEAGFNNAKKGKL